MATVTDQVTISKAVLLENAMPGPTVFKDGEVEIVWEGAGDPIGRDVQAIPVKLLENINFLRIMNRGVLRLFDAPDDVKELVEAQLANPILRRQAQNWAKARENSGSDTAHYMEAPNTQNDYVTARCIGPSPAGRGQCTTEVPVREFGGQSKPPLCASHQDLEPFCVESPTEQVVDGKEQFEWKLATLAR